MLFSGRDKGASMARSPITRNGYNQLHKELENLKKVVRPQVIKAIEEARAHGDLSENAEYEAAKERLSFFGGLILRIRAHGDLSENAEYEAAKERQSFVEKKIHEIEQKLANSEIMDICNVPNDRVGFGSVVTLEN